MPIKPRRHCTRCGLTWFGFGSCPDCMRADEEDVTRLARMEKSLEKAAGTRTGRFSSTVNISNALKLAAEEDLKLQHFPPQPISEHEAQRRSFAYGNLKLHNPNITREMIDRVAAAMPAAEQGPADSDGEEALQLDEPPRASLRRCGLAAPPEPLDETEAKINGALPTDDLDELNDSLGLSLPRD